MTPVPVILLISVLAVLMFLVWSCANISSRVWVKTVCRLPRGDKSVLSFDDGPDPAITLEILDILKEHGIKACFFVIGEKAAKHPGLIRRMVAEGHIVGNHTYSHSGFFPLSGVPCMVSELLACDSAIDSALEEGPGCIPEREKKVPRYFRPPFGVTNPDIARVLKRTGHKVMGWDVRSMDTVIIRDSLPKEKVPHAMQKCSRRIIRRLRPGSVVLLHDRLIHAPALVRLLVATGKF